MMYIPLTTPKASGASDESSSSTSRKAIMSAIRLLVVLGATSLLAVTFVTASNMDTLRHKGGFVRKVQVPDMVKAETDVPLTVASDAASTTAVDLMASAKTLTSIATKKITSNTKPSSEFEAELTYQDPVQDKEESNSNAPWPRIAWLMSFPNSGTSYTGQLVKHLSLSRTATNYGEQNADPATGNSVPIHVDRPEGPFYVDPKPVNRTTSKNKTVLRKSRFHNPTRYVLTKTHCGGYRTDSPPELYVESTYSFQRKCLSTKYVTHDKKAIIQKGTYEATDVHKAIHLIRNPFDNVVSRFNFEQKHQNYTSASPLTKGLSKSRTGFRTFCQRMDDKWLPSERAHIVYSANEGLLEDTMTKIPCHSDFVRYVEWHNQAFVATRDLGVPTMILHYEQYAAATFNATTTRLFDFLELSQEGIVTPFLEGKIYAQEYFTSAERKAVKELVQELALTETWENLKHYFA